MTEGYGLLAECGDAVQVTERFGAGTCDVTDTIAKTWKVAYDLSVDSDEPLITQNRQTTVALAKEAGAALRNLGMTDASLADLGRENVGSRTSTPENTRS